MNLARIHNYLIQAYELSEDTSVLVPLKAAIDEIDAHMDKEKERVKKYRSKEYKEAKSHSHEHVPEGEVCSTCGTKVGSKEYHHEGLKTDTVIMDESVPVGKTKEKVIAEVLTKHKPKDAIDEALASLELDIPQVKYDGVTDDLEDDTPTSDAMDGVMDDLESILSL